MIYPYFLRCKQSDYAELITLGKMLGVIDEVADESGDSRVVGVNACDWDYRGELWEDDGTTSVIDGVTVNNKRLIVDENGISYLHINILTRFDLGDKARAMAVDHPELAQALSNLGKFFLLDANGKIRPPNAPQCSFGIVQPT